MSELRAILKQCYSISEYLKQAPGVEPRDAPRTEFDTLVLDQELRDVTLQLFNDGHYARAVEEAYKFLNNLVKKLANPTPPRDGADLMLYVFSPKHPVLKLNRCLSESELNEQAGYMQILAGCMTGIRNPRAHDHAWTDPPELALQLLGQANHLVERVRQAQKAP